MDLILTNGNIITMDPSRPKVEAVAVSDDKIVYTGNNTDALSLKTGKTEIVDLKGSTVVPGFNDSHMHLIGYGSFLEMVNLSDIKSISDMADRVRSFIYKNNIIPGAWVIGRGWNHDHFSEKRFPTRYDLDNLSKDHPICIFRACGHVCVVNSAVLNLAGIHRNTPQVDGGHFDIDENGEPLGIFRENAISMIVGLIPAPNVKEIKKKIINGCSDALRQGITSIQTDDFESIPCKDYNKVIKAYKELEDSGMLNVRINQQCLLPSMERLTGFLAAGWRTGQGTKLYSIGPVKLLADGSLGARTAYLCESYSDDPQNSGIPVYAQQELDELVAVSHDAGMQLAVHCIGDKAMYMTFESFEKAISKNPRQNHRHSIVHCQITDNALLDKFSLLDVVAHIQPIFLDYDLHIAEARVGANRAATSYNWKGLIDRNVHVAFGSDCPVEPFNVLHGIYCAVTRKDLKGYPKQGWLPGQKLTVEQAVYCFTMGSAYASFEENIKGSITPGKLADMVVLSDDIFSIGPDDIKDVEVVKTYMGGKLVYSV